ncbi:CHAT domain-containing protein [Ekhidna sp.]|uniref:CHAT domain-containing protein n=1 Tax=Ekhidna sp. TaxID=2608089 RepID=UPI003297B3B6
MTHYLPAMKIVRRAALSLCLIFTIPLIEINANCSNQSTNHDKIDLKNLTQIEYAHLYFEGMIDTDFNALIDPSTKEEKTESNEIFLSLLTRVNQLRSLTLNDQGAEKNINHLSSRIQTDVALLGLINDKDQLSPYVINYAYLDRKSHYYSIKLDLMNSQAKKGLITEKSLISFYKVALHFVDEFYTSGLINNYRKNVQTDKYGLLEKMLKYISQSPSIQSYKSTVDKIYSVSRSGEVSLNRSLIIKGNNRSKVIAGLMMQIEPLEQRLYQSTMTDDHITYQHLRNELRDRYLKVIQSKNFSEMKVLTDKQFDITTIAFFSGKDYIFQYVSDESESFQLIDHPLNLLNQEVKYIIDEMDNALTQFSGNMNSLRQIEKVLKSISDDIIKPVEKNLLGTIQIIPDGQLCFFPFEMLINNKSEFLFEAHEIAYQFDFDHLSSEIQFDELYNVNGKFEGMRKLAAPKSELSLENFKSIAEDKSLLHLSTHQIFEDNEPHILLSRSDSVSRGDWYDTPDIMGVLMSMCAGFRGQLISGENARSFGNRAFEAGAENVVSSLWSVDDFATTRLIEKYLENLDNGMTSNVSLRQAKLSYLRESDSFHRHPVFWAAFVHYGSSYKALKKTNYLFIALFFFLPIIFFKLKIRIKY